ncbi:MAG TPA: oligosaccharide flippase family protein [Acidimicrobiales bacterium]|nr:oligosaccharide flippase family protein [Acidimicrobiales bacterium]
MRLRARLAGGEGAVPAVPITSIVNAATFGMGAIAGVVAARSLGPSARGVLTISTIAPMYIGLFGIVGLDEATVYMTSRTEDLKERATILWTGLALSVATGMAAAAVSLLVQIGLYWDRVHGVDRTLFVLFALYPIVYGPAFIGLSSIRGYARYRLWNVLRMIPATGYFLGLTLLALTPRGLTIDGAMASQGAALVVMLVIAVGWSISSHRPRVSWSKAKTLMGFGWRNHLITVQNLTNQRLDQLLLGLMVVSSQVGMYSIAVTFSGAALSMGTGPSLQVFSHLSRDGSYTREQFRALLRRMLIALLVVCAVTWVAAPFVIPLLFGSRYSAAVLPAVILVAGGPLLAVDALLAAIWKATGRPLEAAKREGVGLLATIALLYPAIRIWGINGAAAVSVVSYAIAVVLLWRSRPVDAFIASRAHKRLDRDLMDAEESDLAIELDRDALN